MDPFYPYDRSYYPINYSYFPHYTPQTNYSLPYTAYRSFPLVDPKIFMASAKHMQFLMLDASVILERMATNRKFSFDLMNAAQHSNKNKVQDLIRSTGIKSKPEVEYNPDGLRLLFLKDTTQANCCQLLLHLRWF